MFNFNDPQLWVAISFILFFTLFGRFIWKKFNGFLDGKINEIKEEIVEANKLHDEARSLLSSETKKFQELENNINDIINQGKIDSQKLYLENKERIDNEIKKLEQASLDKIAYLEKQVVVEMRDRITKLAIKYTEDFLIKQSEANSQISSIEDSLSEVHSALEVKKKFI